MATNIPTYFQNQATKTIREGEVPAADFDGGMNLGGSNTCGIGVATAVIDPKLEDWSVLDQAEAARTPQNSQHLGGSGLEDGNQDAEPLRHDLDPDFNDTANYLAATQAAAPDAIVDVTTGAVNKTGVAVEIGDRAWYPVPVA